MRKITGLILATMIFINMIVVSSYAGAWKQESDGRWWYQNDDGSYIANTWQKIDGNWYYFYSDGYMAHDTWIGDFYVGSTGALLVNTTTPDGKKVGADGKLIKEYTAKTTTRKIPRLKEGKYIESGDIPRYTRTIKYINDDKILVDGYIKASNIQTKIKDGVTIVLYQAENSDIILTYGIRSDFDRVFSEVYVDKKTFDTRTAYFRYVGE